MKRLSLSALFERGYDPYNSACRPIQADLAHFDPQVGGLRLDPVADSLDQTVDYLPPILRPQAE